MLEKCQVTQQDSDDDLDGESDLNVAEEELNTLEDELGTLVCYETLHCNMYS